MAIAGSNAARHNPTLDRLPDRMLVDIGLYTGYHRRRSWSEYLQQLTRHIGPTRC